MPLRSAFRPRRQIGPVTLLAGTMFAFSIHGVKAENVTTAEESVVVIESLQDHCVHCHGADEDEIQGDIDLSTLDAAELEKHPDLIRGLIDVLELKEMPPEDEPELPESLRKQLIQSLTSALHRSVAKDKRFEQAPLRRMNRFQYNNAVKDLFDLRCIVFTLPERMMRDHKGYFRPEDGEMANVVTVGSRPLGKSQLIEPRLAGVAAFPQDLRAEHGFDNRGDHLSLSPLLMASFLKLGHSITQSPDFGPRYVGIWKTFFMPPTNSADPKAEARRRLRDFLTRAFRRTVDEETLDRYSDYAALQLDLHIPFVDTMKSVAAAVIASPRFLYLYDQGGSETSETIDDFELASRLSFFLWGSLPDQTLLDLASDGALGTPEVLSQQIERMLTDRKLKRFCDSFPAQWLQLERIISSVPDREKFPGFYFLKYRDSMHMMLEPLLLFETVLIEDLPITQLIDSDFTYRSSLLQEAYGELGKDVVEGMKSRGGGVGPLTFYRIPVTDRRNGGVITNSAVMTMTAGPLRTQPITRGAWIAGVIFNDPPEPPPADVPPLAEKPGSDEEHLTLRERLALHRERADCKGCHEQIDPLGFALENYNPIGAWRERYENGKPIDPKGQLFRTHNFTNVVEFKDAILAEREHFAKGFTAHLLSFALARPLRVVDKLAVDEIVDSASSDDFRLQTLIKSVILSEPFRSKSERQPVAAQNPPANIPALVRSSDPTNSLPPHAGPVLSYRPTE